MPVRRARSIDDLYDRVEGYDVVLSTEAALTLALDRRIDHARIGRLSATPRSHASGELIPRDNRTLFHELATETDLTWKQITYALENVLDCWEHTGDIDAITAYPEFDTPTIHTAVEVIREADSAHGALAETRIPDHRDVAVVGEQFFTELDRHILPEEYDVIDPFVSGTTDHDNTVDLPEFAVFDSATAVVQALLANVTPETAERVGVVVDRSTQYPTLVESAFESADIPYQGGPGFADDDGVRTFLRLARAALTDGELRLEDVRPLLVKLGHVPDPEADARRLGTVDDPAVDAFEAFRAAVNDRPLDAVIGHFEDELRTSNAAPTALAELREECVRLGILDARLTRGLLDRLTYYVETVEVPVERDSGGVLLADATAAAYVDRPVVFYLGLGTGWTRTVPRKPWVDRAEQDRQNLLLFQLLVQNGREQHFLVQESQRGDPVTPCLYFHDLLDTSFETFTDLPHRRYRQPRAGHDSARRRPTAHEDSPQMSHDGGRETGYDDSRETGYDGGQQTGHTEGRQPSYNGGQRIGHREARPSDVESDADHHPVQDGFDHDPIEGVPAPDPPETLSQSSLNTLVNSPRDYFFGRLVDEPTRDYRIRGTLLHDVAECYVDDPDFVRANREEIVAFVVTELSPYVREVDLPLLEAEVRVAIETLEACLDADPPENRTYTRYRRAPWGDNRVAAAFDHEITAPITEQWFEDPAFGGKGLVDLLHSPTRLVDYKTGRRKSARKVVENADFEDPGDTPDFQSALYLAHHRREVPDERLEFTFLHLLEARNDVVTGTLDPDDVATTVTYYPTSFGEFAATREAFDALVSGVAESNNRRKSLERLGYDAYASFFEASGFPDADDRDALLETDLCAEFVAYAKDRVGDYKYVTQGCRSAFKRLYSLRERNYFTDDLDAFEAFLDAQLDAVADYHETRFPVGDPNPRRLSHRDLLLTEEKLTDRQESKRRERRDESRGTDRRDEPRRTERWDESKRADRRNDATGGERDE